MFKLFEQLYPAPMTTTTANTNTTATASASGAQISQKATSTHALKFLSIFLGLSFILLGTLKLTNTISKDLHKDLIKEFVKYSKIFPFAQFFGFKIRSKWYRKTVGVLEISLGGLMAFFPNHKVRNFANISLVMITTLSIYSHFQVNNKFMRTSGPLVFLFMLLGRLMVYSQMNRRLLTPLSKDSTESELFAIQTGLLKQD